MEKKISVCKCLAAGLAAGFINGFFGAGGGMILVPLLILWIGLEDKKAFASAICVIFPLCIVSLVIYGMKALPPLGDAAPYLLGGAAGGVTAGLLFKRISAKLLHIALGALILFGGVRLIL